MLPHCTEACILSFMMQMTHICITRRPCVPESQFGRTTSFQTRSNPPGGAQTRNVDSTSVAWASLPAGSVASSLGFAPLPSNAVLCLHPAHPWRCSVVPPLRDCGFLWRLARNPGFRSPSPPFPPVKTAHFTPVFPSFLHFSHFASRTEKSPVRFAQPSTNQKG